MPDLDDVLERGRELVRRRLCPACDAIDGREQPLQEDPPDGFHWHGNEHEHRYLFCPEDGLGYRLEGDDLRVLPSCNGGLHPSDVGGTAG